MPRHESRAEVRFKDVFDAGAAALSQIEVGLHFTKGVDDGHFPLAFDAIRALGEAAGVNLFDFHGDKGTASVQP